MNVLVLTPDRVGSTLLQRLITIYMQVHYYNKPVINLHELTNGLMKYFSPVFNREVLGKPNDRKGWGYFQTLPQITELLQSTDHYKTSRLAHYHLIQRKDSREDQIPFYEYLNNNFYIIAARRENLLEHALSWCITLSSKHLNVYNHQEKVEVFAKIYRDKITVQPEVMIQYLNRYCDYLAWADRHFAVSSYFNYEQHMQDLEQYILNLDIFNGPQRLSWQDIFDIDFQDWNRCHYLISDLSGIGQQLSVPQLEYQQPTDVKYELQSLEFNEINRNLSVQDHKFMSRNGANYVSAYKKLQELIENKVLVTGVPIKLQTLLEKKLVIKNFAQCVEHYNKWVEKTGVGQPYTETDIEQQATKEILQWHATNLLN